MKRIVLLLALVPAVAVASALPIELRVQVVPDKPVKASINLTAEQRHVIKENVLTGPDVKKEAGDVQAEIGGAVPAGIALQEFPKLVMEKIPQTKAHRFFIKGNVVVIVSADDNKIAEVIE